MHEFGKGFGKPVGQCLQDNTVVVVTCLFESPDMLIDADAGRYGKAADVICQSGFPWRDKIRQAVMRLAGWLVFLLPQVIEGYQYNLAKIVTVYLNVVTNAVCREKPDDTPGRQPFFVNQTLKQGFCVSEERTRRLADPCIRQNVRKPATELPGIEKRHPVDVARQGFQGKIAEYPCSPETWLRRRVAVPSDRRPVIPGLSQIAARRPIGPPLMLRAPPLVFRVNLVNEVDFRFRVGQCLGHAN